MKQAKVKRHTVGFFRKDAEAPFINLEMFETITAATSIPHYWRDGDGNVSLLLMDSSEAIAYCRSTK